MEPQVSIIILNWNGKDLLRRCLRSLTSLTNYKNYKIVLVDNGSTDGSKEFIKSKYPKVKLIELPKNYGFARACNEGIYASSAPYIALLNNDIEVDENWLSELYLGMERHPECGMGTSKTVSYTHLTLPTN